MDISNLDLNHIELFALAYSVSKDVFDVEPITATAKTQRKIRKWVKKTYINGNDLPDKVLRFVVDSKSDPEFVAFMAACDKYIEEQGTWKKQLFEKVATDFSDDVKKAFSLLFETTGYCDLIENKENQIIIPLGNTCSYRRNLILHTSKENHIGDYNLLDFSDGQILKDECGYRLICTAENYEEDTSLPITIFFDRASTAIELYRADRIGFGDNPWESLGYLAIDILDKNLLGPEYFNEKEQDLIPLLKELRALTVLAPHFYDEETPDCEALKQYIKKHNLLHLIPLIEKITNWDKKKPISPFLLGRLSNALNDAKCEGLWRELYALIVDSQEGYADKLLSCDQKQLNKIRAEIEENFHSLGYEGQYPTFIKKGALKGIRLEESYNQSYFVGQEKNTQYIVECRELLFDNMLRIQFICGTAFLKKDETVTDIYSCCFKKKGRRLFKTVSLEEDELAALEQFVKIAAKRAECTKLNKKERALIRNDFISWQYFALMFGFMGGLFSILMTAAMFLICCLVTAIILGFGSIPEMIKVMPWWQLFVFCFVGFGGTMAFIDIKAKNK